VSWRLFRAGSKALYIRHTATLASTGKLTSNRQSAEHVQLQSSRRKSVGLARYLTYCFEIRRPRDGGFLEFSKDGFHGALPSLTTAT
jgi:hypothetical protein